MTEYEEFLENKRQLGGNHGFNPLWMPDFLFDFQKALVEWAVKKGRAAIFADCGLGKTPMQLVWAQNVIQKTNKPVLILTPLAVGQQTLKEADKFGIESERSRDGLFKKQGIVITNYEKLHLFSPADFSGVVCDESSILKNFDGITRKQITEFMRLTPYRLLCSATAAPNDYFELGTSSEALGELGFMDMLNRFFKKTETATSRKQEYSHGMYRFRGHAEKDYWRWVCSWARAMRKPSDFGFEDGQFLLPELVINEHVVQAKKKREGYLFDLPAITLEEQRDERKRTLHERCEMAASLIQNNSGSALAWCYLNSEGDLLKRLIPGSEQVSGDDSDEKKEEIFSEFQTGKIKILVTKPIIAGWGLNWQHCCHQTFFPSHSFEQWYQAIRRSWRFGQKNKVKIDMITSQGEARVMANLQRKTEAADRMFQQMVELMTNELKIEKKNLFQKKEVVPSWLS